MATANPIALSEIVSLAKRQLDLEAQVSSAEESLKALQEQLRYISQEAIPAAMAEAGLSKFTLDSGETVTVKEDFVVGIPAERRDEAYGWLESHGFGGLIKTEVQVPFGKGELGDAIALAQSLSAKGKPAVVEREIHWQTLKAFIAEQYRECNAVPMDLFGAIPRNKTTIKAPKTKG